jgi:hypothetical protein
MLGVLVEILRLSVGTLAGMVAVGSVVITYRMLRSGRPAYDVNREVTYPSVLKTMAGQMIVPTDELEPRACHGLAVSLDTRKVLPQHRLSSEAVDDVIGATAV